MKGDYKMTKQEKKLFEYFIYEAYHITFPRLMEIGKDDFKLCNLNIFFDYDIDKINMLLNSTISPNSPDEESVAYICGTFNPNTMNIIMRLEAIFRIANSHDMFRMENNRKASIEKLARSCNVAILTHELFHYNQKVDFGIEDPTKRLAKEEYAVYQKTAEFIAKHMSELVDYLDCDTEFIAKDLVFDGEEHTLEELHDNAVLISKNTIKNLFPDMEYTPYEYADPCNFIARYIYSTYTVRANMSERYNDKILISEKEIYDYTVNFINDYKKAKTVKIEFDIYIRKLYLTTDTYERISEPRTSGYVLLKEDYKDLDELTSIERMFIEIQKKIDKALKIDKKHLLKLDNKDLFKKLMKTNTSSGEYIMFSTIMEYSMRGEEMVIFLRNLNFSQGDK